MEPDDILIHYGVLGMRWGRRRGTRKIEKTARKDAQRHMDAKMAYGKGAGTRRKLLKAELFVLQNRPQWLLQERPLSPLLEYYIFGINPRLIQLLGIV